MYQSTADKIYGFIINLISKYIVWIVIIAVLVLYWFFPDVLTTLGVIVLFWGPVIVICGGLVIALTSNAFKFKKRQEQGMGQYEIVITNFEIIVADLIIYLGALLILLTAQFLKGGGADIFDLLHALIFFIFATWLKQLFTKKIIS